MNRKSFTLFDIIQKIKWFEIENHVKVSNFKSEDGLWLVFFWNFQPRSVLIVIDIQNDFIGGPLVFYSQ